MHSASRSRKYLRRLPLFAGAAIAGGGLTLLVACDFDRVSTSYLLRATCPLPYRGLDAFHSAFIFCILHSAPLQ